MRFLFGSSKIPVGVTLVAGFLAILATVAAYAAFHSFTSDGEIIYIKDASPAVVSQFEVRLEPDDIGFSLLQIVFKEILVKKFYGGS